MNRLCRALLTVAMLAAAPAHAEDNWGTVAVVSGTMGVHDGRLCYGEATRGDIGCPADAPLVSGSIITGTFVGDGSGLTGVTAASADRIVSGTAQVIANGSSNSISITEAGVTTGYYYNGVWVAGGVSTTGAGRFNTVSVTSNASVNGVLSVKGGYGTSIPASSGGLDIGGGGTTPDRASIAWGDGTGWKLNFGTYLSSVFTPRVTFMDTGRVGISTTSPNAALSVYASSPASETVALSLNGNTSGGFPAYGLGMGPTTSEGYVTYRSGTGSTAWFGHKFLINNTEVMRLNGLGRMGIGTTAPTTALEVSGTISATNFVGKFVGDGSGITGVTAESGDRIVSGTAQVIANGNSNSISITEAGVTTGYYYGGVWVAGGVSTTGTVSGSNGYFVGNVGIGTTGPLSSTLTLRRTGTNTTIGQLDNGLRLETRTLTSMAGSEILFAGHGGTNAQNIYAAISAPVRSNSSGATGELVFSTKKLVTDNIESSERMRIASSGNVGIGTSAPTAALEVSGTVSATNGYYSGNVGIGTISPSNALTIQRPTNQTANLQLRADNGGAFNRLGGLIMNRVSYDPAGEAAAIDFYRGSNIVGADIVFRTNTDANGLGVSATERMRINEFGNVGIKTSAPSTTLDVKGTLRIADNGAACDTNRAGAIRYASSSFDFCDGGGTWKSLATMAAAGASPTDRLVSGTSVATLSPNGDLTVRGRIDLVSSGILAIGTNASQLLSGTGVTTVGVSAGRFNSSSYFTAMGYGAGYQNIGSSASLLGYYAGYNNTGANTAAFGVYAAQNNSGTNVTAIGTYAGQNNSGNLSTLIGYYAGQSNTGGSATMVGYAAGGSNSGTAVTAAGYAAAQFNTGASSAVLGYYAGYNNIGNYLTAIGAYAGQSNTGSQSTLLGYYAGRTNTGTNATMIGYASGSSNSGTAVTAVGQSAANANTGNYVTALGYQTGYYNTFTNVTLLGSNITSADKANQVVLGNGSVTEVSTSGVYVGSGLRTTGNAVVSGTLQISGQVADSCGPGKYGTMKIVDGRIWMCRQD